MVIDYRKLNAVTKKNAYPIPHSEDLQSMVAGATWYSAIDLWAGYNQIGMTPRAQERSAFVTKFGHYEFTSGQSRSSGGIRLLDPSRWNRTSIFFVAG